MKKINNLWGDLDLSPIPTPKSILNTQAQKLKELTNDTLHAYINTDGDNISYDINFRFCVSSNILGNTIELFTVSHDILSFYPNKIKGSCYEIVSNTENEFIENIRFILNEEPIKRKVINLYQASL